MFADPLFKCPTPAIGFGNATEPSHFAHFCQGAQSQRLPRETTSERPKVLRRWCALYILTSKCASRRIGVNLFDISTAKSGPHLVCFVHFNLEMCFAPQRRALFKHHNFQKRSDVGLLCAFWLRHVLSDTTACNFLSLIWPAGSAPAALASLLLDPPEPQTIGKTQCFATFLPFRAPGSSFFWFFWIFLFFDLLSSSLLFSDSSHLCFSFVHIVGSLTSKLPSTRHNVNVWAPAFAGICHPWFQLGKTGSNLGNRRTLDLGICGYKISKHLFQRFGTGNS